MLGAGDASGQDPLGKPEELGNGQADQSSQTHGLPLVRGVCTGRGGGGGRQANTPGRLGLEGGPERGLPGEGDA